LERRLQNFQNNPSEDKSFKVLRLKPAFGRSTEMLVSGLQTAKVFYADARTRILDDSSVKVLIASSSTKYG